MAEYDGDFTGQQESKWKWYKVQLKDRHSARAVVLSFNDPLDPEILHEWIDRDFSCDCYRGSLYFERSYQHKGDWILDIPCNHGEKDRRFSIDKIILPDGYEITQGFNVDPVNKCEFGMYEEEWLAKHALAADDWGIEHVQTVEDLDAMETPNTYDEDYEDFEEDDKATEEEVGRADRDYEAWLREIRKAEKEE